MLILKVQKFGKNHDFFLDHFGMMIWFFGSLQVQLEQKSECRGAAEQLMLQNSQ